MKKLFNSVLVAGALAFSASASATIFDFQDLVDNGNEDGGTFSGLLGDDLAGSEITDVVANGEAGFSTFSWTKDGITLTATAGDEYAYLDKGNAGLGACAILDANDQCNPSNDDNVTFGEILTFSFSEVVAIDLGASTFRDGDHNLHADDHAVEYRTSNGGAWVLLTAANEKFSSDFLEFQVVAHITDLNQFYIDALAVNVPEPGSLALLGLGLAGLGLTRRRKA